MHNNNNNNVIKKKKMTISKYDPIQMNDFSKIK